VLAVGTELLLGQIIDTNSSWLGEQLAAAGIESHLQVKVGDNLARMEDALSVALVDADAVIVCGGLGPTHDDLTREAIASLMGVELVQDDAVAAVIREIFSRRNREMPAPGLVCPVGGRVVYALPGVPHEMKDMFERAVLPDLLARSGEKSVIRSRVLRTWGDSESRLNERLDGVIADLDRAGNPTLAFLASGWEGIKVRLTVKAPDEASALGVLAEWESRVRAEVGDVVFGTDDDTMESVVLGFLRGRGLTLGLAESVTGGLVGGRLTNVPGSSSVFRGAVVSYASDVKFGVLGVEQGPVVSEEAAAQMARGAQRVLGCDVALALTGVAGPDEQDGRPVGTLCVAVVMPDGSAVTATLMMPPARDQMRQMSVITALDFLRRQLVGG
jgi:nicotinamide-nucleotide amidase